jgi:hypothetical protein
MASLAENGPSTLSALHFLLQAPALQPAACADAANSANLSISGHYYSRSKTTHRTHLTRFDISEAADLSARHSNPYRMHSSEYGLPADRVLS